MAEGNQSGGGGYGKPPKSGQFKPGQSGNPAGRPRKKIQPGPAYVAGLRPIDRVILREAERPVRVREGDQVFELSQEQAVIRSTISKAIKGSPMAQRTIIAENQRVQAIELCNRREAWDWWQSYVADWHRAAARAEAHGKQFPTKLPHPDDIEFAPDLRVHLRGPSNSEELKRAHAIADFRDLFLAMQVYADDLRPVVEEGDQDIGRWLYCSLAYNALLPPSLRVSSDELFAGASNLIMLRRPRLEEHIGRLCSRVGWTFTVARLLAGACPTIDMRLIGLQRIGGVISKAPRLSVAKLKERMWEDVSFEHLTQEKLDLLERNGLAGPPAWMARARAAIAARQTADSASL